MTGEKQEFAASVPSEYFRLRLVRALAVLRERAGHPSHSRALKNRTHTYAYTLHICTFVPSLVASLSTVACARARLKFRLLFAFFSPPFSFFWERAQRRRAVQIETAPPALLPWWIKALEGDQAKITCLRNCFPSLSSQQLGSKAKAKHRQLLDWASHASTPFNPGY